MAHPLFAGLSFRQSTLHKNSRTCTKTPAVLAFLCKAGLKKGNTTEKSRGPAGPIDPRRIIGECGFLASLVGRLRLSDEDVGGKGGNGWGQRRQKACVRKTAALNDTALGCAVALRVPA